MSVIGAPVPFLFLRANLAKKRDIPYRCAKKPPPYTVGQCRSEPAFR